MSFRKNHIEELLEELRENKIHISLGDDVLKLKFNGTKPAPVLIEKLKAHKQELLGFLKDKENNQIAKVEISDTGYPLSSSQFRLWIISQIEKYSISYNMPFQIVLEEEINASLLEKSISSVIKRHESLRTVFKKNEEGEIQQWIITPEALNFELNVIDVSLKEDAETLANKTIKEDYYVPFDLENGPLIRCMLLKINEKKWLFYFNMHHIISDGWSIHIFSRDIMQFYKSYAEGKTPVLPELSIQYKDYAKWQRIQLKTAENKKDKAFWETIFSDEIPVLELPSHQARPNARTNNGHLLRMYLPESETKNINTYISGKGGTLFMFLIASLNTLLYRYSGSDDIILGTPVAGREHLALENQIGFYVNTLAIRTKMNAAMSFNALYNQTKQHILEVYAHQKYPFDQLIDDLKIKTSINRNPLFDVLVILQNFTNSKNTEEFKVKNIGAVESYGAVASKFDLTFCFAEIGGLLSIDLNYNTDIYNDDTMRELLLNYRKLVQQATNSEALNIQDFTISLEVIKEETVSTTDKKEYDDFLEKINNEMSDDF
ncbi:Linear gramicidin synthase subunit B [Kordia antarctica]|uniref:Linear gramicidin synthase subunit B n=1 Tax=Kordia antarctica TaxID=1218801 RepID=A0A7L4ZFK3_9FLAO|nr:condensation domain-containing protein [Kordia antarctica]QHI35452.1 Linear gramicidin synthase subunit B [Kordia antarctica]